jgi:hypothetical protein
VTEGNHRGASDVGIALQELARWETEMMVHGCAHLADRLAVYADELEKSCHHAGTNPEFTWHSLSPNLGKIRGFLLARERIENPAGRFSVAWPAFHAFINPSFTAPATLFPCTPTAQSWHTQFELVVL